MKQLLTGLTICCCLLLTVPASSLALDEEPINTCTVTETISSEGFGASRRSALQNCLTSAKKECTGAEEGEVVAGSAKKISIVQSVESPGYFDAECSVDCKITVEFCQLEEFEAELIQQMLEG